MGSSQRDTSNNASAAENVVQAQNVHGGVHIHSDSTPVRHVVPHQLPAAMRHFVNRTVEQDALTTLLNGADHESTVLISTVDGLAGVGKTTLVVQWAHGVLDQFPDGELYVNLRGFDPAAAPLAPAEALIGFLTALGVAPEVVPADQEARAAQFRTLLHDKRMLIVLDNARDAEQVLPLLPGSPGCLVVITSRQRLDGLVAHHGAHRLSLATLTQDEGRSLLARHLGAGRLAGEAEAVATLLEHCAGLPLALTLVAVQAAAEPDVPLADLAADLSNERERLDTLDMGGRTGVRAVFSWSYRSLSPQAAMLFRQLGLPTCPEISLASAAALAGLEQRQCRRLLSELTRSCLLTRRTNTYVFHDLLRAYARERAYADDREGERAAALRRLIEYYFYATYAACRQIFPEVPLPALDVTETTLWRDFSSFDDALAWWDSEHANVTAVIGQAVALGIPSGPWLAHIASFLFKLRGRLDECKISCDSGLEGARAGGDRVAQAELLRDIGGIYSLAGKSDVAVEYDNAAADIFSELGDQFQVASTWQGIGETLVNQGRYEEAVSTERQVLQMLDDSSGNLDEALERGAAHAVLGFALAHLGDFANAFTHLRQALDIDASRFTRGYALRGLGFAYLRAGYTDDAIHVYQEAVACSREIGHHSGEARGFEGLGTALRTNGDTAGAREAWQHALAIFDDLGHPSAETLRTYLNDLDKS